ncbi:MAG: two-component system response regulator [Nannocystales bacterium]
MEGSELRPAPPGRPKSEGEAEAVGAPGQEISVLVVEDDPAYGCLIRAQLMSADPALQVKVEEGFEEALHLLCSGRFQAATIDHQLGSNTGLQLIELAREQGVEIPLVLLTGSDDPIIEREAVQGGASDFLAKSEATGRLLARTVRFNVQRCAAAAALAEREQEARHRALHDPLTGLANRAKLDDQVADALVGLEADPANGFSLLYMDLDGFKPINDQRGHAAGDAVLVEVARRLRAAVRGSDCVSRVGGDEFVILLADSVTETGANRVAEAVQAAVEVPIDLGGPSVQVGVSIGIRVVTDTDTSPSALLAEADVAMYSRKQERKNRVGLGLVSNGVAPEVDMDSRLRTALETGLVVPHFQPIVTAGSSEAAGFEALARWTDDELGKISPAQFIPAALRTGLIVELGRQMLMGACNWVTSIPGKSLVSVSVNVSADHVRSPMFETHVRDALSASGLDPRRLQLELTEQVEWGQDESIDAKLGALRGDGVCLVLDDFGTGYSTAEVLARFPVTSVKLSRGLLVGAQADPRRECMYGGLVELGKRMGASITAEGIETAEDLAFVKRAGATHIQGFMFGRPAAMPDIVTKAA